MYVSVCVSIYSLYIYIYTYPIQYIVQGGGRCDPLWRWVEVTIPFNISIFIYIYIYVCIMWMSMYRYIYIYQRGWRTLPLMKPSWSYYPVQYLLFRGGGGIWSLKASGGRTSGFFPAEPPWRLSCWRHFPEQPSRGYPASAPSWRSNISAIFGMGTSELPSFGQL